MGFQDGIWEMDTTGQLTEGVEAAYRTLLYDLDLVAYNNCNFDGNPIPFRKSLLTMAQALASLVTIDHARTREASYNLSQICKAIDHPLLTLERDRFNSDNLRVVHMALASGLYRLVSGRNDYDQRQHEACLGILGIMDGNLISEQKLGALDTITGCFNAYGNLQALLALELHDRQHGTHYGACAENVLDFIETQLFDAGAALFRDEFHTGAFGFPRERLAPSAFWCTETASPGPNALALCLYHHFRPDRAREMWESYKKQEQDYLLGLDVEVLRGTVGTSYLTELGGASEAVLSALWCAREMGDRVFFDEVFDHFVTLVEPRRVETKIVFTALDDTEGPYCVYFSLLAAVQQPWRYLLDEYDWPAHYGEDYDRVR